MTVFLADCEILLRIEVEKRHFRPLYKVGQKRSHYFTACNFIDIEQILSKFAQIKVTIYSEHRAILYLNQFGKIVGPSSE